LSKSPSYLQVNKNDKNMKTVYVLHHTNQGTPESGEIHSIYAKKEAALAAMEKTLESDYESSMDENEEEDYIYMYISEHTLHS